MLTRRKLLGSAALIAGAAAFTSSSGSSGANRSLRQLGTAISGRTIVDSELVALVRRHCRSVTPEVEWKWAAVERAKGVFDFTDADRIATFATANAMALRGHALVWHASIPDWAMPLLVPGASWSLVGDFMAQMVGRYGSSVEQWDVVNEPIEPQDGFGGRRVSPFYAAFGRHYVERALEDARSLAPKAKLFINEYGLEYNTPAHAARRAAMLELVRSVKRAGVPLDAIGLQSHLDLRVGPFDAVIYREFLKHLTGEGVALAITEFDVKESDYPLAAADRDQAVADHAARFLDIALAEPAMGDFTCWGLSDRLSWLQVEPRDYARFPDQWTDGSSPGLNRGAPFAADLRAKPLWTVLRARLS